MKVKIGMTDYGKIWSILYEKLIHKCKTMTIISGNYYEKHHILPKHMGGDDSNNNLVLMTTQQHALAHFILFRIHKNKENKIAYLMKSGQTDIGNKLRVELAVHANRTYGNGFKLFVENNPMKNPIISAKSIATKKEKYGSTIVSSKHYENICKANRDVELKKKKLLKWKVTFQQTLDSMSIKQRKQKYGRSGIDNHWYGKTRPNELAGNFGKTKGTYQLIDPQGNATEFQSFSKLRQETGLDEGWIKRNRNIGIYNGPKKEMIGFELKYFENTRYGEQYKKKNKI